jgi:hypothetical protein
LGHQDSSGPSRLASLAGVNLGLSQKSRCALFYWLGNIVSPSRYDAGACHTLSQENSRLTAIYRYTFEPVEFGPISAFRAVRQQHK